MGIEESYVPGSQQAMPYGYAPGGFSGSIQVPTQQYNGMSQYGYVVPQQDNMFDPSSFSMSGGQGTYTSLNANPTAEAYNEGMKNVYDYNVDVGPEYRTVQDVPDLGGTPEVKTGNPAAAAGLGLQALSALGTGVGNIVQSAQQDFEVAKDTPNFQYNETGDKDVDAELQRKAEGYQSKYDSFVDDIKKQADDARKQRADAQLKMTERNSADLSFMNRLNRAIGKIAKQQKGVDTATNMMKDIYNNPAQREIMRKAYAHSPYRQIGEK